MLMSPADYAAIVKFDYATFVTRAFYELNPETDLQLAPHIELIASKLEDCRLGKTRRLIINICPRSLKSHCATVAFPAWLLGHDPSARIICVCYGQDLSEKFARDCRNVMMAPWYKAIFPTRLVNPRAAVSDFGTTKHGVRMATSVGGVLTGRGADFIILDDPQKPEEALSETQRKNVNEWFDNTLLSRLDDKQNGCIIIIMQRLHQDDLVGHVLEQGGWEILSLPAIAPEDERHLIESPLGNRWFTRKGGGALHPEREPLSVLGRIRQACGEYTFLSQYQQAPAPVEGFLVKKSWLRYYNRGEEPGRFGRIVQSWDTANKGAEINDFSVCTTWGVDGKQFYLLDVFRERLNYPDLRRAALDLARRFDAETVVIEDKASGTQLIQDLKSELVFGIREFKVPPNMDKIVRLHAQTTMFENGHVLLPRGAPWLVEYINEITGFPGTKHNDQVDSTTQALAYIRENDDLEVWVKLGEECTA